MIWFKVIFLLFLPLGFSAEPKPKLRNDSEWPRNRRPMYETYQEYGESGCGLGSMLVGKNGNQSLAVVLNGIFFNQTFAVSSGTSNCVRDVPTGQDEDLFDLGRIYGGKIEIARARQNENDEGLRAVEELSSKK